MSDESDKSKRPPLSEPAVWDGSEPDDPEPWSYPTEREQPPPRATRQRSFRRKPYVYRRDWWKNDN